jgi:GNAT superfamily N-acetyltransferase
VRLDRASLANTHPVSDTVFRDLQPAEREWAASQYQAIRFFTSPPDAVALVAEQAGVPVGLGRLVRHADDVVELGGIWTADAARGRGVARGMVSALLHRFAASGQPGPLWCIPFLHLAAFYQSFGFAPAAQPWPESITHKMADIAALGLPGAVVLIRA